jgi:hypothetical protein
MDRDRFMTGFLDELEKRAVDPISVGIGALGGHLALNAAVRQAYKNPRLMPDVLRQGYQHGLSRKKITPLRESMLEKAFGPEIAHEYHQARHAGRMTRVVDKAKTPEQRARLIRLGEKLSKKLKGTAFEGLKADASPEELIRKLRVAIKKEKNLPAPAEHVRRAALRERVHQRSIKKGRKGVLPISGGAKALLGKKTVHEKHTPGVATKALSLAPEALATAGTLAGSPVAAKGLGHILMNRGRGQIAKTKAGKEMVKKEFLSGVKGKLHPAVQAAKSYLISPGYADVGNIGATVGRLSGAKPAASPLSSMGRRIAAVAKSMQSTLSRALPSRRPRMSPQ